LASFPKAEVDPVAEADLATHEALTTTAHGGVVAASDVRLSAVFNVKASPYSAAGNGTTDDTTAVQAAITAAAVSGGIVYFPPGTYSLTGVSIPSAGNVTLAGAGMNVSLLQLRNGTNADLVTVNGQFCTVRDLGLDGNYPSNLSAGNCLKVMNTRFQARNLWVANARAAGLWIVGTSQTPAHAAQLSDIEVYSCQGNGIIADSFAYDLKASNIWIGLSGLAGLLVNSTEQQWTNLHSWGSVGGEGVKITAGDNCKFVNCYLETNASHGISINNAKGTQVVAGHLWKNTRPGPYVFNAPRTGFSMCRVTDNSEGVSGQDGIRGDGTSTDCRVVGCDFAIENTGGGTSHQTYGVHTISSCDRWILSGNKYKSSDLSTGSTSLVGSNNWIGNNDDGTTPPTYVQTTDSRLSDARTPTAHASAHLPGGTDAIAWGASIIMSGTDASLPAAAATNAGCFYFATDTFTLYRSTGSAWVIVMIDTGSQRFALGSSVVREPYPRYAGGAGNLGLTGGQMQMVGVQLFKGDVITNVSFMSGSTALTQGTNNDGHWWFALYSSAASPSLLAQTADQGTAAWAGGAIKTLALTAAQTIATTGWYWAALMVNPGTGGTPATPTIRGVNLGSGSLSGGSASGWPSGLKLGATNGSSLGASAPAGPITPAAGANYLYCQLS